MSVSPKENNYTVCIVDDDQFLLDMYMLKFKEAGCDVQGFTESKALLEHLKGGAKPDAVLLDLVMPGMNGLELLAAIRSEALVGEKTVLVVLSNQSQDGDMEAARQYSVDAYLIKASTVPSEVLTNVLAAIRNKQR